MIERCLRSLDGAVDEIVLVHDGPCSDRTLEIAERYGARIAVGQHMGESEAHRPLTFELATGDWVLRIDADEFLSDELRTGLPELVSRADVDGWDVMWPIWSHRKQRYVTRFGPRKRILTRRSASMRSGLVGEPTLVRGTVEQAPSELVLEHRPLYESFSLATVLPKWRGWARLHARQYLTPWDEIPRFGYPPGGDWPARRRWGNRLSPILVPLYGVMEFVAHLRRLRQMRPMWQIVRISAYWGLYAMLVQLYVVKYRYFE